MLTCVSDVVQGRASAPHVRCTAQHIQVQFAAVCATVTCLCSLLLARQTRRRLFPRTRALSRSGSWVCVHTHTFQAEVAP